MTIEECINEIMEVINDMSMEEMVYIHNEYCEDVAYYDDRIYFYEELNELCCGMSPLDIIEQFGHLAYCDYFKCGVYVEQADSSDIYVDDIATYCVENDKDFNESDIRDLLDELAESEEEDEE